MRDVGVRPGLSGVGGLSGAPWRRRRLSWSRCGLILWLPEDWRPGHHACHESGQVGDEPGGRVPESPSLPLAFSSQTESEAFVRPRGARLRAAVGVCGVGRG